MRDPGGLPARADTGFQRVCRFNEEPRPVKGRDKDGAPCKLSDHLEDELGSKLQDTRQVGAVSGEEAVAA